MGSPYTGEARVEADFETTARRVLASGETDDPAELERRADDALLALVAE